MSGTRTRMSAKDIKRVQMMGLVADGKRDLARAAEVLGVSYRQAKRIYGRYREEGPAGVVHRNLGQRSHRSHSVELKAAVLEKYRGEYADFGPTLAAEKMGERDGLQIDHETLRRWLIGAGMWEVKRRRGSIAAVGNESIGLGSWCSLTAATTNGLRNEALSAV